VEHLRQLSLKHLEFGDLLLDGVQLLRHESIQTGTHRQTFLAVKFHRQSFELGEGES
jgi:hypothetical protein